MLNTRSFLSALGLGLKLILGLGLGLGLGLSLDLANSLFPFQLLPSLPLLYL